MLQIHLRLDNGVGFLMDALAVAMRIFGQVMPCQSSFLSPSKDHRPAGGWEGGGANERSGSVLMVSACLSEALCKVRPIHPHTLFICYKTKTLH
jgi:hypothetical protein